MSCSEEGKPLSKKALKKLQKEKEKAERKAATAAKLAEEKAARDAANVVCLLYFNASMLCTYNNTLYIGLFARPLWQASYEPIPSSYW